LGFTADAAIILDVNEISQLIAENVINDVLGVGYQDAQYEEGGRPIATVW
jgi:hypothetical protein